MALPPLNLLAYNPATALVGDLALTRPAITARLTTRTTAGQEALMDGSRAVWMPGVHHSFNECFSGHWQSEATAHARIDATADQLQAMGVELVRCMHWDLGNLVFQSANGARCSWWTTAPNAGAFGGTMAAARSSIALERMNYTIYAYALRGIRMVLAWDAPGHMVTALGVAQAGGTSTYPNSNYWHPDILDVLKTYQRFILDTSNPYTGNLWGNEPSLEGLEYQNEQSAMKNFSERSMLDPIVEFSRAPYLADHRAEWAAFWVSEGAISGTTTPFRSIPADTFTGFPVDSYVDPANIHPRYQDCIPAVQARWTKFLYLKHKEIGEALLADAQSVYPTWKATNGTLGFAPFDAEQNMSYTTYHKYLQVEPGDTVTPSDAVTVTAAAIVSNRLRITLSTAPQRGAGQGGAHLIFDAAAATAEEPAAGQEAASYVRLAGITVNTGTDPNGDRQVIVVTDQTHIEFDLVAADKTFVVTGATAVIAARQNQAGGASMFDSTPIDGPVAYGAHMRPAGVPCLGAMECQHAGYAANDVGLYTAMYTLGLADGQSGYAAFTWGTGNDYITTVMAQLHDVKNQHGRNLWQALLARAARYNALDFSVRTGVTVNINDAAYYTAGATSPTLSAAQKYHFLNTSTSDWWRPVFNTTNKRLRMTVTAAASTVNSADESLGSNPTAPYTFGNPTGSPKWVSVNTVPTEGVDSGRKRIEWGANDGSARVAQVSGRIYNGRYGRLKISGLPAEGWFGGIIWVSDGNYPLGQGRSLLGVVGMTANAGFAFCDGDERRQYLTDGSTGPRVDHLDGVTIELDTYVQHTVTRRLSSGSDAAETTAVFTVGTGRTSLTTGATLLWTLEPVVYAGYARSIRCRPH